MGKRIALGVLALVALAAALWMRNEGNTNANLTEMRDLWWVPLPLAAVSALLALSSKPKPT